MDKLLDRKLSVGTKIGYGFGSAADSIGYDWVTCFFIYFLTDFAGISPAFAGLIIFLAVIWDAITDPIIGTWSDNCKSKYGRRRPFIIGSAIPLAVSMILMFLIVPFEGTAANIYYLVTALMFWTAYTAFNVPYYSLGVSLSYDEKERVSIREYSTAFMYAGAIAATFLPTFLIGMFINIGYDEGVAWSLVGTFQGILAFIMIFITWRTTRGKEILNGHSEEEEADREEHDLKILFDFKLVWRVLKPKSIRMIFIISFMFYLFYTISNSSVMYFVESNLGLGEWEASFLYLTNGVVGIFVAILLSKLSYKWDKKILFMIASICGGIPQIIFKFIGMDSILDACVLEVFVTIGNGAFWLFTYAFIYDATEIEEFISGERREGLLVSYQSFIQKLGAAVGGFVVGQLLSVSGYVGALYDEIPQSAETLDMIESMFTIIPGAIMVFCALLIWVLPITKKKYDTLLENLELKREGKVYSTEGFEDLLK